MAKNLESIFTAVVLVRILSLSKTIYIFFYDNMGCRKILVAWLAYINYETKVPYKHSVEFGGTSELSNALRQLF